jgi:hypothetical protein
LRTIIYMFQTRRARWAPSSYGSTAKSALLHRRGARIFAGGAHPE